MTRHPKFTTTIPIFAFVWDTEQSWIDEPWVGRGGLDNGFGQWLLFRSSPVNPTVTRLKSLLDGLPRQVR